MDGSEKPFAGQWGLILGASSGFGEATALALAKRGMSVFGVHFDRAIALAHVQEIRDKIKSFGADSEYFNVNAADDEKRAEVVAVVKAKVARPLKFLLHSLAFGSLKPFIAADSKEALNRKQMEMTVDVMAHSLVWWTQDLLRAGLLGKGSRIMVMTSAGSTRVWKTYGAVSAAKAALESHIRQLTLELAPHGITCNSIRAGVTMTPALQKIPGNDRMMQWALEMNPHKRATTPEDVAETIAVLCQDETRWMTGNVIGVDGGEFITG
ncbi:MAG: 3-oxoacyl-ACP reductase [Candidatus Lindowbacteria bacterium RIFCSPLOWO2_12_FULL_62_27]|nr:MAG: 3-oxoacyl-ACP reductase [Candidatus Lindowbacteria bacterium RIFCSPLOWO2_02_FULL_62_12]OGH59917.1 MAG: 3-oxoacyl-ACP reductase [Candidatus Lindowbacteria bacterium RIFCSPLOWO2_12_FULL_62_27]